MKLKENVYIGRDNAIRLQLLEDGVVYSTVYPAVTPTRWVLAVDTLIFDSAINPEAFAWDSANSILELHLGALVMEALDFTAAELTIYASEWPDGIVWLHPISTPDKLYIRITDPVYEG